MRLTVLPGGQGPDMTVPVIGACCCPHCGWDDDGHLRVVRIPALEPLPLVVHGRMHEPKGDCPAVVGIDECHECLEPLSADNVKAGSA